MRWGFIFMKLVPTLILRLYVVEDKLCMDCVCTPSKDCMGIVQLALVKFRKQLQSTFCSIGAFYGFGLLTTSDMRTGYRIICVPAINSSV